MKESINPLWQNDLVPSCLVAFKPSNQQWDLQNLSLSTCKKEFDTFSDIFLDTKVNVRQYLTIGFHSSYVQQNFQISSSGFCEKMVPYWGLIMGRLHGLAGALNIIIMAMSSHDYVLSCYFIIPLYHRHIHDHVVLSSCHVMFCHHTMIMPSSYLWSWIRKITKIPNKVNLPRLKIFRREYIEDVDKEMDLWLVVHPAKKYFSFFLRFFLLKFSFV